MQDMISVTLSVVETYLALIPTGLMIMKQHYNYPNTFTFHNFLAPLMIQALKAILSVKSRSVRNGLDSLGAAQSATEAATQLIMSVAYSRILMLIVS